MMADQHISAVLYEMSSAVPIITDVWVEKDPQLGPLLTQSESSKFLPMGALKALVYLTSVHSTGTLQ